MNSKYLILSLLILSFICIGCPQHVDKLKAQEWIVTWDHYHGEWGISRARNVAVGPDNSVYVIGKFLGRVDLDPGAAEFEVESVQATVFLNKFNPNGDLEWIRTWGPLEWVQERPGGALPQEMAIDNNGDIYIYSSFYGAFDFDPGPREEIRSINSYGAAYLSKLTKDGELLWVLTWSDITKGLHDFELGESGNFYLSGSFTSSTDFDPGPDIYTVRADEEEKNCFFGKFDQNGKPIWIQNWVGLSIWDIALDTDRNTYLACSFYDEIDLDPGESINIHEPEGFEEAAILKLSSDGNLLWFDILSGLRPEKPYATRPYAIGLDENANAYLTGYCMDLKDPDREICSESGCDSSNLIIEAFLVKYKKHGSQLWKKTWGLGAKDIGGQDMAVQDGKVYITGYLWGEADFDPSSTVLNIQSLGENDIFVSVFDLDGTLLWMDLLGNAEGFEKSRGIDVDNFGNVYITGHFGHDSFLAKYLSN